MSSTVANNANLLFQSEMHPLVPLVYETESDYCLALIHKKAYARAAEAAEDCDVLDLGCNNGYGTATIAARCRSIIGADVSAAAISEARTQFADIPAQFECVDGGALPFADGSFDFVTSFQVIEHVVDVETYLAEICRVLRPGGAVLFTTPNRDIRLDPGMPPWNRFHVREYSAAGLRDALSRAFGEIVVEGLFAKPDLYAVEFQRVSKARRIARLPGFRVLRRMIFLRDWARTIRRMMRAVRGAQDGAFLDKWSLDDLYYRTEDLDRALDLIAVCRKPLLTTGE